MMRLLLPFTQGIDESVIIAALVLAERFGATLVVLSLICLPEASDTGPCWQDIQQSNDFLTFVLHKAARWGVPVERIERYTHHPICTIRTLAQETARSPSRNGSLVG